MMIAALALAPLVGLGRRVAGGVLNQWFTPTGGRVFGDYPARAIYGATGAVVAFAAGTLWWHAALVIPAMFLGCAMPNKFTAAGVEWGGIDLGRGDHLPWWRGWAGLAAHGVLSIALVTAGAWWIGAAWWWAFGASAAIAPLYALGWAIASPRLPPGFRLGSETGEFLWGCALGAAFVLTFGCW